MRRSVYLGSPGGTRMWPVRSAVLRSAVPLPCATQMPPEARSNGSSADTMPLAGGWHSILPLTYLWMYGSRLATTISGWPARRSSISSCKARLVHMDRLLGFGVILGSAEQPPSRPHVRSRRDDGTHAVLGECFLFPGYRSGENVRSWQTQKTAKMVPRHAWRDRRITPGGAERVLWRERHWLLLFRYKN